MVDTTARTITLGGREFRLPMLPPRANRTVYPLCVKLDPLVKRTILGSGNFAPTREEYADVLDCVSSALSFADPCLPPDEFENLVDQPQAHFDALLIIRLQTGGWVITAAAQEGNTAAGEETGGA